MMARSNVRRGLWPAWPLAVALALGPSIGEAAAQEPDNGEDEGEEPTTRLVFEREVFQYTSQQRDPFHPLTEDEAAGPRFEDLTLLGVISGNSSESSIALVDVSGSERAQRLRVGDVVGNVRVVEMGQREMTVEVEEFEAIRERTLRVQRPGAAAGVEERPEEVEDGEGSEDGDGEGDGDDGDDDGDDSDDGSAFRHDGGLGSANAAGGAR